MRRLLSCVAVLVLTAAPSYGDEPQPTDAATLVELTKTALHHAARGDEERARAVYREMLSIDPDHALARRALGYVRVDAAWLTGPEARHTLLPAEVGPARRRKAPDVDAAALRRSLRLAPRAQDRADAAAALAGFDDQKTLEQLRRSALTDRDGAVRQAAIDALGQLDARRAVHHFGGVLSASRRERRVRAAEALARLGGEVAAHYLVSRWELVGGKSPRAYFATLDQRSYIQDFDTEVA